jgi:hypothetical protein
MLPKRSLVSVLLARQDNYLEKRILSGLNFNGSAVDNEGYVVNAPQDP